MSLDDIKVRIRSFFDGKGFAEFTKASSDSSKAAADATKKSLALAGAIGSMEGPLGKAASGVAQLANGFMMLGPVGAMIAGLKVAVDMIGEHFIKKANQMKEAAERMGERVRAAYEKIKAADLKEVNDQLAEATTKAAAAASRFEAMAAAYMKIAQANDAVAKSGGGVRLSGLALEKSKAMLDEKDKDKKALVGAGYDVRIAESALSQTMDEQDRLVSGAKTEASDAEKRRKAAINAEKEARLAVGKANAKYEKYENAGAKQEALDEWKARKDEAEKALAAATNNRIKAEADATAAALKVTEAENNRLTSINSAKAVLNNAREAEQDLIDAQKKAAQAELEKMRAAEKAAEASRRKADADRKAAERDANANLLTSFRDSAAAKFESAFDLWRDPEAAASAVEADRRRGEDMKRFRREVNRYGGKWKIDEYASLMRAGDEEGMQDRLAQWRKSSKFTPQVEQMVKAAAAEQNRNAAEKSLANIEKNTQDLAKKLDELLSVK